MRQQSARLSALQIADDPSKGVDSAMALQMAERALQSAHAACLARLESSSSLRVELERLADESAAMLGEANASRRPRGARACR